MGRERYLRTDNVTKRIVSVVFVKELDDDPDLSYLGEYSNKPAAVHIDRQERGDQGRNQLRYFNAGAGDPAYIEADYKRYEAYHAGDWCMTWLQAKAEVVVQGVTQYVTSGGLGGVESDSGPVYFGELRTEQLDELATILKGMGFGRREIQEAISKATDKE